MLKNDQIELIFRWNVNDEIIEERLLFNKGTSESEAIEIAKKNKQRACSDKNNVTLKEVMRVNRPRPSYFQTNATVTRIYPKEQK